LETTESVISLMADVFTILASGIAIYLFFWKGKQISSVFKLLLNYSTQITLTELRDKLDTLNTLNANNDEHYDEVVNVMNDIIGQIRGNHNLIPHFSELLDKINKSLGGKKRLTEPNKRSFVSELREKIRHAGIVGLDQIAGEK
jgi:hypothetical protein